jgi:hypothetical protein
VLHGKETYYEDIRSVNENLRRCWNCATRAVPDATFWGSAGFALAGGLYVSMAHAKIFAEEGLVGFYYCSGIAIC